MLNSITSYQNNFNKKKNHSPAKLYKNVKILDVYFNVCFIVGTFTETSVKKNWLNVLSQYWSYKITKIEIFLFSL